MKKSIFSKLLLAFFAVLASVAFTACGDDDETQNGWFVTVDTELSSANFNSNLYIQSAVNSQLQIMNNDFMKKQMSEGDAKKHFNAMCNELKSKVDALGLPVLDDTYCTVYLTHSIADPNGKYPVIASKKVSFASKAD